MQQLTTLDRATEHAGGAVPAMGSRLRNPGLGVVPALTASASELRVRVLGGEPPVRLALYVDGELAASIDVGHASLRRGGHVTFSLGDLAPGRHAVTVRAVDATGRWGGASMVVSVSPPATSPGPERVEVDRAAWRASRS